MKEGVEVSYKATLLKLAEEYETLHHRQQEIIQQYITVMQIWHGSLDRVADRTHTNKSYLFKLSKGSATNPSPGILTRLGLLKRGPSYDYQ